jgi:large subunit ribosomal protein L6
MSRIGKKLIEVPEKTEVTQSGNKITVKGPKGTLERTFAPDVVITINGKEITLTLKKDTGGIQPLWGTTGAHLTNMIKGVNEMFSKKLILEGIGYKADIKGTDLVMALGFSHPVKIPIPTTLKVTSEKGIVTVTGLNKDEVGQFAANIRAWKKPEPYKGKGFRYDDEVIRRKQGKKSV